MIAPYGLRPLRLLLRRHAGEQASDEQRLGNWTRKLAMPDDKALQ